MSNQHLERVKYQLFLNILQNKNQEAKDLIEIENLDPDMILNGFSWTPLHTAAYSGNMDLIMFLLKIGASTQKTTSKGFTAKDLALEKGHVDLTEILTPTQLDGIINYNIRIGQKVS